MNAIEKNNKTYWLESYWKSSKGLLNDSHGHKFPTPKNSSDNWAGKDQFLTKLEKVEQNLQLKKKNIKSCNFTDQNRNCLICGKEDVYTGDYTFSEIIWQNCLIHYIKEHNIKPSVEFIDIIYKYQPIKRKKTYLKFKSDKYIIHDIEYVKLDRNQIMIMDALLRHGGYTKKYTDLKNRKMYRYSEHSGLLDFNENGLEKIIISGETNRIDRGDEEIYLPRNISDAFDYEYIFHTHPPTPKPGGRVKIGILYEFPSISDIFHFIDHFNSGMTQGSLVIASEGMYNIRKLNFDRKKITINEENMYKELRTLYNNLQDNAIDKYGDNFNTYTFYSKIAQDTTYINSISKKLNEYELQIDYYPRTKEQSGKWIIESIYLPIFITEQA
jgi:hypothetical protein